MPPLPWHEVEFVAVDIGNTRTKLAGYSAAGLAAAIPSPAVSVDLPTAEMRWEQLAVDLPRKPMRWVASSVHRPAAAALANWLADQRSGDSFELLTHQRVPLKIDVDYPDRVGMDRLMVCVAADHLREAGQAAIVVAIGSAITVNLLTAESAFAGGAILPGIYMAAEALSGKTDALPLVSRSLADHPPPACGKNTEEAIASGLYWGAVGAVRELIHQIGEGHVPATNLFFTGGDGAQFAAAIDPAASYRADMVLLGVALTARQQ